MGRGPDDLQRVDGGLRWYGRFSNPLPTAPSFFPIGVWFESVTSKADIAKDRRAGLNTYVVLTSDSNLRLIESNGMRVIAQHGEWTPRAGARGARAIAGWELADEIDMQLGPQEGFEELQRLLAGLPADGRLRYNNYGKGVMFWETAAEAAPFVNAQGPGVRRHLLVHGQQHLLAMGGRGAAEPKHPIAAAGTVSPRIQLRRHRPTHAPADTAEEVQDGLGVRRGRPPVLGGSLADDPAGPGAGRRVAQLDRRSPRHHLLQPQLRQARRDPARLARAGVPSGSNHRHADEPAHQGAGPCA
jgi:hypothetical protein